MSDRSCGGGSRVMSAHTRRAGIEQSLTCSFMATCILVLGTHETSNDACEATSPVQEQRLARCTTADTTCAKILLAMGSVSLPFSCTNEYNSPPPAYSMMRYVVDKVSTHCKPCFDLANVPLDMPRTVELCSDGECVPWTEFHEPAVVAPSCPFSSRFV